MMTMFVAVGGGVVVGSVDGVADDVVLLVVVVDAVAIAVVCVAVVVAFVGVTC